MKTLSIIIAAALPFGAGYAGQWDQLERDRAAGQAQLEAQIRQQQYEEMREAQRDQERQIQHYQFQERLERENYLRQMLEDCE